MLDSPALLLSASLPSAAQHDACSNSLLRFTAAAHCPFVLLQYMGTIDMPSIDRISRRKFTVEEAKAAREVFMAGSSMPVRGVTKWDGDQIYTGDVGRTTMALHRAIEEDMDPSNKDPKAGYGEHVMVPFGFSTGMLPKREPIPD